jgi:hypothetical protein
MSLRDSLRGLFAKPYQQIHAIEANERMDGGAILLGMRAWLAAGLPVVAKGGRPGSVI